MLLLTVILYMLREGKSRPEDHPLGCATGPYLIWIYCIRDVYQLVSNSFKYDNGPSCTSNRAQAIDQPYFIFLNKY